MKVDSKGIKSQIAIFTEMKRIAIDGLNSPDIDIDAQNQYRKVINDFNNHLSFLSKLTGE
jgi:hypothetical protein